jgi:hypothetical protein
MQEDQRLNSINMTLRRRSFDDIAREQQIRNVRNSNHVTSKSHVPNIVPAPVTPSFTTRINGTLVEIQPTGNLRSTFINLSKVVDVSIAVPSKNQFVISILFLKKITNEPLTVTVKCTQYQEAENLRELLYYYRNKIHSNCKWSTGIHDGPTVGTGSLDDSGFWEHPCHVCARRSEITNGKTLNHCWPYYERVELITLETDTNQENHDSPLAS